MNVVDRADGVRIAYDPAGTGDVPLVFVHGWCCDRTVFAPQVEHFSRGHRWRRSTCEGTARPVPATSSSSRSATSSTP